MAASKRYFSQYSRILTCTAAADGYASMVKGQFAGNPQYRAPEVISALRQQMVDGQPFRFTAAAAESWSAGVVLYFAATGTNLAGSDAWNCRSNNLDAAAKRPAGLPHVQQLQNAWQVCFLLSWELPIGSCVLDERLQALHFFCNAPICQLRRCEAGT